MLYETICQYVFAPIVAGLIAGLFLSRVGYHFQKELLRQQLDFQKFQGEEDARLREEIYKRLESAIQAGSANIAASLSRPVMTYDDRRDSGRKTQ